MILSLARRINIFRSPESDNLDFALPLEKYFESSTSQHGLKSFIQFNHLSR